MNCDETWCRVRLNNKKQRKGYIWCLINKAAKIVIFFFDEGSRGRKVLTEFLGDANIKALKSDAYNAYYYLDDKERGIEHLCCLEHARAKSYQAWIQGKCEEAKFFLAKIEALYNNLERTYKEHGFTPELIKEGRNSAVTIEIISDIRQRVTQLLSDGIEKSEVFQKALNYLNSYWTQIIAYRNDGRYEIDNSIAERAIRPMTVERKNKVAFGSEKGAMNSCAFHPINGRLKLQGKSIKKYYHKLLSAVASGRNDYENLTPALPG